MKPIQMICRAVLLLLLLAGGSPTPLSAQTPRKVEGKVTNPGKQPIAGAVVLVKGTTRGTTTLGDGSYSIQASARDVLVFSLLGYAEQEVAVNNRTRIDVTLEESASAIDEVVIEIGYGGQARKDITGTLSSVKMEDLVKAPVMNFDQALQGRLAGVSVSSSDGQPGAEMDIVIRGANSLTQSNAPLYVIDGFPIEDFSNAAINSADIASITVLKDASATAIYGARGANGVIIIETKKGVEGKPVITYSGTYGFQTVTKKMDMMDAYDFVMYQIERQPSSVDTYLNNLDRTLEDYKRMGQGIDWQDKLFRNAAIHMHNLSMTGGTKQTKYAVSLSMADQKGVLDIGGTLRLGSYPCRLDPDSRAFELYGEPLIHERHRHRYEVNNDYRTALTDAGMRLCGMSPDGRIVEMLELPDHPYFLATQAHPEFNSRPNHPHPLFLGLISSAVLYRSEEL